MLNNSQHAKHDGAMAQISEANKIKLDPNGNTGKLKVAYKR
jgi:hypothetical protein